MHLESGLAHSFNLSTCEVEERRFFCVCVCEYKASLVYIGKKKKRQVRLDGKRKRKKRHMLCLYIKGPFLRVSDQLLHSWQRGEDGV